MISRLLGQRLSSPQHWPGRTGGSLPSLQTTSGQTKSIQRLRSVGSNVGSKVGAFVAQNMRKNSTCVLIATKCNLDLQLNFQNNEQLPWLLTLVP